MSIFSRLRKSDDTKESKKAAPKAPSSDTKSAEKKPALKIADEKKGPGTPKTTAGAFKYHAAHRVLLQPVITEKATLTGTYIFAIADTTNKVEVKKAIRAAYGVTPVSVRVMNVRGKAMVWSNRSGKRKDWKKAIVRLKKGETINVYQGT